jgi:hypothetical protein
MNLSYSRKLQMISITHKLQISLVSFPHNMAGLLCIFIKNIIKIYNTKNNIFSTLIIIFFSNLLIILLIILIIIKLIILIIQIIIFLLEYY